LREEDIGLLEYTADEVEPYVVPKLGKEDPYTFQFEVLIDSKENTTFNSGQKMTGEYTLLQANMTWLLLPHLLIRALTLLKLQTRILLVRKLGTGLSRKECLVP
jgi:hypothetical protein